MSMAYSMGDKEKLRLLIYRHVDDDIDLAFKTGTVDELMGRYNTYLNDTAQPMEIRPSMKILVVGHTPGKVTSYQNAAKSLGINPKQIDFVGYDEFKNFSLESLRYSTKYSDVIVGPIPHSSKGKGDHTSALELLELTGNRNIYPNCIRAVTYSSSESLKFSITDFRNALLKTRLFSVINKELDF